MAAKLRLPLPFAKVKRYGHNSIKEGLLLCTPNTWRIEKNGSLSSKSMFAIGKETPRAFEAITHVITVELKEGCGACRHGGAKKKDGSSWQKSDQLRNSMNVVTCTQSFFNLKLGPK